MTSGPDVRRGADRPRTRSAGVESAHSFSFGHHYDPGNTSFGLLLVHNEDVLRPGAGFDPHPHRDTEVVTWVLAGALAHEDSAGRSGTVRAGEVQRMSAGTGVVHAERNAGTSPGDDDVHLVQMWLSPDALDREPEYQHGAVDPADLAAGLVPVASGRSADAAVRLGQRHATLLAARPAAGQHLQLPDAPYLHVFVARGTVTVEGAGLPEGAGVLEGAGALGAGDAVRLTRAGGAALTAGTPAEVLVWEMHAALGP